MWCYKGNFKSDGFTLIELLGVIVIMSIFFSFIYYIYIDLIKSSEDTINETSKEMVMDAVWDYYNEFMDSEEWVQGYNEDDKLSFCVSFSVFN